MVLILLTHRSENAVKLENDDFLGALTFVAERSENLHTSTRNFFKVESYPPTDGTESPI
jgi:hypothetical protein